MTIFHLLVVNFFKHVLTVYLASCTLFLVFLSVIKFILIKYCNLKSILITVIFHYNNNEINVFSFKLLMSPECDTTTKNHNKIKRDMQIQT